MSSSPIETLSLPATAQVEDAAWEATRLACPGAPSKLRPWDRHNGEKGRATMSMHHCDADAELMLELATGLSDRVEAEELGSLLNEYFGVMSEAVFRHGGTLLSFIGDAVMVVFGAPAAPQPVEDAQRAVELGLDMQRAVSEWGQSWRQRGLDRPPAIRVGIHSGYVTIGTFGTRTRSEYSAMGRTTNLAARVQSAAPSGGVLITWATRALAGDGFVYADRGLLQAKGLHTPIEVFEVWAQSTEARGVRDGCACQLVSLPPCVESRR